LSITARKIVLKAGMKDKNKKAIFILQLSEGRLKIVKYVRHLNTQTRITGVSLLEAPSWQEIGPALAKEGFSSNEVKIALPRNQATCRFLKLPAKDPQELEKISGLQAGLYLPYPAEDLVTAYQLIQTDKHGFSMIVLTICHKNAIANYLDLFSDKAKHAQLSIILSSYGLCNLFYHLQPEENATVLLVDMDEQQAELVIVSRAKVIFSRSARIDKGLSGWGAALTTEITKTKDAFVKEGEGGQIGKIVILAAKDLRQEDIAKIGEEGGLPVEYLNYAERLHLKEAETSLCLKYSFAGLLGLAIKDLPDSLNILPGALKEAKLKLRRRKEMVVPALLISGIFFAFFLGMARNLENKKIYLQRLEKQLSGITGEAKPLEDIEKRFRIIADNSRKKDSPLAILYELHHIMPVHASLINLSYEEGRLVVLRGETTDINDVFNLVPAMEKSPAFARFNIKIRFATRRKTQSGEVIDFEIVCAR